MIEWFRRSSWVGTCNRCGFDEGEYDGEGGGGRCMIMLAIKLLESRQFYYIKINVNDIMTSVSMLVSSSRYRRNLSIASASAIITSLRWLLRSHCHRRGSITVGTILSSIPWGTSPTATPSAWSTVCHGCTLSRCCAVPLDPLKSLVAIVPFSAIKSFHGRVVDCTYLNSPSVHPIISKSIMLSAYEENVNNAICLEETI